jgi:tetraacyldisaccharide 4'-kinase
MDSPNEGSSVEAALAPIGPHSAPTIFGRLLWPLSIPYGIVAALRRRRGMSNARRLSVPVISVGNITCGGTGKTPTVEMIVRDLRARGRQPTILSRGYRASSRVDGREDAVNDEFLVLDENLGGVPHLLGRERFETGTRAIEGGADVIVLDDGFQHVRLERDLDMVLLDASCPFDNGCVLPAGLLREPLGALRHADLIAITRCELVGKDRIARIRERIENRFPGTPVVLLETQAIDWKDVRGGESRALEALRGNTVSILHAIGNAGSFHSTLDRLGVVYAQTHEFPDHHTYRPEEIDRVATSARDDGIDTVVMTQKDAVKLRGDEFRAPMEGLTWLSLSIRQAIRDGRDLYEAALDRALAANHPG